MVASAKKKAYDKKYNARPEQLANRAARGRDRYALGIPVGDPRDVDHKDGNPRNNSKSNLRLVSKKKNRGELRIKQKKRKT